MRSFAIFLGLVLILYAGVLSAQEQTQPQGKPGFMDRIFFGGGVGAGFGDVTFVSVSPIIGYRVSPKLTTGVRLMYQYTTFKYYDFSTQENETYNGNDYSIAGFATYSLFGPVFLQGEYEHLNYDGLYYDGSSARTTFNSVMAGAGISQPIGRKAGIFMVLLYNFSYESFNSTNAYRSPYNSPWILRVGISGGF